MNIILVISNLLIYQLS